MRAQDQPGAGRLDEEGVLLLAGRVVGGDVEGVEGEPLRLDLGALGDLPAHRDEDVLDALGDQADRVPRPQRSARDPHRQVDGLLDEDAPVAVGLELGLAGGQGLGHLSAGLAHALAGLGLRARRQGADLAVGQRERALLPLVGQPGGLELVERAGRGDRLLGVGDGPLDLGRVEGSHLDGVVLLVGS